MGRKKKRKKRVYKPKGTGICVVCGAEFPKYRKDAKYCRQYCRYKVWVKRHPRVSIDRIRELEAKASENL